MHIATGRPAGPIAAINGSNDVPQSEPGADLWEGRCGNHSSLEVGRIVKSWATFDVNFFGCNFISHPVARP